MSGGRDLTNSTTILWDIVTLGEVAAHRAALTGDVTAAQNSNTTNISDGAVTTAKLADNAVTEAKIDSISHNFLLNLAADDHTQYALLAGRAGGQVLTGGTASGDDVRITSTANATKGTINLGSATTGVFIDETNSRLVIGGTEDSVVVNGTTYPAKLAAHVEGVVGLGVHQHTATAAFGSVYYGSRSRGTEGAETVVQGNDVILEISAVGYDGTDYAYVGQIFAEIDGTPGNNDMPGRWRFLTTPDGGSTALECFRLNSDQSVQIASLIRPDANDGAALGTATISWSDLFLASGAVINYSNGTYTITQSGAQLTFNSTGSTSLQVIGVGSANIELGRIDGTSSTPFVDFHSGTTAVDYDSRIIASGGTGATGGGALAVHAAGGFNPAANDSTPIGTSSLSWSDLFLASGAVINFANSDVTLTHSSNKLLVAGGELAGITESFIIACSDETTAITAGTAKVTFRMPYAFTATAARASLTTAQASGNIFTVDINEAGTSILSTKLTIDNTELTSTTAATAVVISDTALADDASITIDVDQIGNGTAKGLKVTIIGYRP